MCGIFGVIGRLGAPAIVHEGLRRLEYRGYDSVGIAWADGGLHVVKSVGSVSALDRPTSDATAAIGHTRWATHGGVTKENAHPHLDGAGRSAVVHNGVLLNHVQLRTELESHGVKFQSDTDSEALVHLWRQHADAGEDTWKCLHAIRSILQGTYSIALLDGDQEAIAVAKFRNPLWIGRAKGCSYLASDAVALAPHCREAIVLEDGDHGIVTKDGWDLRDMNGRAVERDPISLEGVVADVHLGGYEHYMLKEIHETPHAVNQVIAHHVRRRAVEVMPATWNPPRFLGLGAGTSFHAALLTREFVHRIARVPALAARTPEWKDDSDIPEHGTLVTAFSQSGETLDTVQALARLRSHPQQVLAFTNYANSTIGRQSEATVPLRSGVEVSVAATKTFVSQSVLGYLMAIQLAMQKERISSTLANQLLGRLVALPRLLHEVVFDDGPVREAAAWLANYENLFILAKGIDLPAALEGALKFKEIAYQHAEAYPAGELKHGPFALLTESTPVLFLVGPGDQKDSILNSLEEVAARGSPTLVLTIGDMDLDTARHRVIRLPSASTYHQPFVHATALHLLSYWTAKARGLPIDKPRNLAKSVTVE